MGLLKSHRHTAHDLEHWAEVSVDDEILGELAERRVPAAIEALRRFADRHPDAYAGVSWGKDSVVVADLVMRAGVDLPLVWIVVRGVDNPDCPAVRDAFLERWPDARYDEITVDRDRRPGVLTSAPGFAIAAERYGDAHVSGVRGSESQGRSKRMARWGVETARTLAPIGHWSGADVFGYLARRDLPVHPAYACTFGGALNRERIRVAAIGGSRGAGVGRSEWERAYYRDEWEAVRGRDVTDSG